MRSPVSFATTRISALALVIAAAGMACGSSSPAASPGASDAGSASGASACLGTVQSSALGASQVQALGTHGVGETISFSVPPFTASVTIVEQAVSVSTTTVTVRSGTTSVTLDNVAVPFTVSEPDGTRVYDDSVAAPADGSTSLAFFASDSPGTGTITIPNTTAGLELVGANGLAAGTWSAVVSDYAWECAQDASCSGGSLASTYDVTVLTKPFVNGSVPAGGSLDVAFTFATTVADGPSGQTPISLTAANAASGNDPDLNRMLETLATLLSSAGIKLRNVSYHDLDAAVQASYASGVDVDATGVCAELAQLLRHAAAGATLNVFFVSQLRSSSSSSGGVIVGVDGTIPGPATIGATVASGVAVATGDLRFDRSACAGAPSYDACGADLTAYVIAHEAGHFLGLYHVTEQDGLAFDPLADTATCPCSLCKAAQDRCGDAVPTPASPHLMTVAECTAGTRCGGGDNLMFWILDTGSQGTLTADQQAVIVSNPLVQ
jgi:hypothetical protein